MLLAHLGLGVGKWVSNIGSCMTVSVILVLICAPFFHSSGSISAGYHPLRMAMPAITLDSLSVFAKMIFGALTAFEFVAIFAAECRKRGRKIARASFIAAPIIAFLYIFGTAAILAFVAPDAVDYIAPIPQALSMGLGSFPVLRFLAPLSIVLLLGNYM